MSCGEPTPTTTQDSKELSRSSKAKNLLLIVVDDLGFNDLAINNNNPNIHTPNMDDIAKQGMRFTRHYAAQVCSPARAALLTGFDPERLGFFPNASGISSDIITMPEYLQSKGYTTWHIGKWHLGDKQRSAWPDQQGFDHWFGFLNQWRLAGVKEQDNVVFSKPTYLNPYLQGDREPGKNFPGHLENILTEKALSTLSELGESNKPWFLNLWYYAPHAPIVPDEHHASLYPDTDAGRYRALVHQLDHNIGRITAQLKQLGMAEDTILVVVSDNGGTTKQIGNNLPYNGRKATITEGGLRTPLLIRWANAALNEQVVDNIITIEDLYPTLMEALEIPISTPLDGVSYFKSLSRTAPFPTRNLFWDLGSKARAYGALSADGRWRLYQPEPFYGAVVAQKLYDLELDPSSYTAVDSPAQQSNLQSAFVEWYGDVHTISTNYTGSRNGLGRLTGDDLQRTPGFGGYTFGIEIPAQYQGQIASQAGVWNMYSDGKTVIADFGTAKLRGKISGELTPSQQCHSVVVTGTFWQKTRGVDSFPSVFLTLYVDGKKVQSKPLTSQLLADDPSIPTLIGKKGTLLGGSQPKPPIIMNVELSSSTPVTIEDFIKRVCS